MRIWLSHGVAAAILAITFCVPGALAAEEIEALPYFPAGGESANAPLAYDPIFDEEFDAELELESNMEDSDPFENANRKVFAFNRGLDTYLFSPITRGYRFVVPKLARKGVRQVFLNLNSPRVMVNDLLQLRFKDAATTFGRLVLNSTVGIGGLLDPGTAAGWERHDSDFGQTLGKMGVASGPYIVVPVFGPKTLRDGFGDVVDLAFQPLTYILGPTEWLLQVSIGSGRGLTVLEHSHDKVEALEESSVDFYAAMRSAYLQIRRAATEESEPPAGGEPTPSAVPASDWESGFPADVARGADSAR
jgi:phospholipid-binding lipoprotein MlaA